MGDTTIRVSEELADQLWKLKERGDSYEDVIWRLIDDDEPGEGIAKRDSSDATPEPSQEAAEDDGEGGGERRETAADIGDVERVASVDGEQPVQDAVDSVATGWEDTPERLAARKQAAIAVLQHALETGDAVGKSSEIVDDVRDRIPVEGQNAETYWRKNIRPVLKEYGTYSPGNHGYTVDAEAL